MSLSTNFRDSVSHYSIQLKEIGHMAKYLQKSNRSLSDCRLAEDTFNNILRSKKDNSRLYGCQFKMITTAHSSALVMHKSFEKGIVKLRRGLASQLNRNEK